MKVLGIIQARMGSSRLPGKVMLKLNKITILEQVVSFLRNSKHIDKIIIATTNLPEDDILCDLAQKIDIDCFRGSSENVLERYYKCAKLNNGDLIVRITGDSPLIDYRLTDKAIKICQNLDLDYISNVLHLTYPLGYNSGEVFPFRILKKLYYSNRDRMSKEHVTYDIRKHPELYNVRELLAPKSLRRPNWRFTIDYTEDYTFMKKLFSLLPRTNSTIKYDSIVKLLEMNSKLLQINQKYSINTKIDKINLIKDGLGI
tara:strand:+ start:248 stop:1021 length:774 start_codon:yes stop_codon:yes gene_type:complete